TVRETWWWTRQVNPLVRRASGARDLALTAMRIEDERSEPLAEINLGIERIGRDLELDDVELQTVECAAHVVIAILGLHDNRIVPLRHGPDFLFLGQGTKVTLSAPVEARGAQPVVEHPLA